MSVVIMDQKEWQALPDDRKFNFLHGIIHAYPWSEPIIWQEAYNAAARKCDIGRSSYMKRFEAEYAKAIHRHEFDFNNRRGTFWGATEGARKRNDKVAEYEAAWEQARPLLEKGYTHSQTGHAIKRSKTYVTYLCKRFGFTKAVKERQEAERLKLARQIFELHKEGCSFRTIAKRLRVGQSTVYTLRDRYWIDYELGKFD